VSVAACAETAIRLTVAARATFFEGDHLIFSCLLYETFIKINHSAWRNYGLTGSIDRLFRANVAKADQRHRKADIVFRMKTAPSRGSVFLVGKPTRDSDAGK
jgi:hypothetical protein